MVMLLSAACHNHVEGPKNIAILGDSYSTFEGYIPEGYAIWYWNKQMDFNDVCCVDSTWWKRLCDARGYNLLINSSYSGSTIGNTGYGAEDYSDRSFLTRATDIILCDTLPDIIYIFGGTNDSWADSPLGELKYSDWTKEDYYKTLPAYCRLIDYLKTNVPAAEIIFLMNTELKQELTDGLREASAHYGVGFIEFNEIDKQAGHPSNKGMRQICEGIMKFH